MDAFTKILAIESYQPKTKEIVKLMNDIYKEHKDNKVQLYQLSVNLIESNSLLAKKIGSSLVSQVYELNIVEINKHYYDLANCEDWKVREWIASVCGEILYKHYHKFYPVVKGWASNGTSNVKRCVALAAMYAGKKRNPEYAEELLSLIEVLLVEQDMYVRKNLGPFAIGDGLLRYYPFETRERIKKWIHANNEIIRWNIGMIFTSSESLKHQDILLDCVLPILEQDDRKNIVKVTNKIKQKHNLS